MILASDAIPSPGLEGKSTGGDARMLCGSGGCGETAARLLSGQVLLVSAHRETGYLWKDALGHAGIEVVVVRSATEALQRWEEGGFDMAIIHNYGRLDGTDLCRRLRERATSPILLVAPSDDEAGSLQAYCAGADECVLQPVSTATLLAKVRAWLRHRSTVYIAALDPVEEAGMCLHPDRRELVTASGRAVQLTPLELRLLHVLMTHCGQVLPQDLIVSWVWGASDHDSSPQVRMAISRLRRKIETNPHRPRYIRTIPNQGYSFCD